MRHVVVRGTAIFGWSVHQHRNQASVLIIILLLFLISLIISFLLQFVLPCYYCQLPLLLLPLRQLLLLLLPLQLLLLLLLLVLLLLIIIIIGVHFHQPDWQPNVGHHWRQAGKGVSLSAPVNEWPSKDLILSLSLALSLQRLKTRPDLPDNNIL